MSAAIYTTAGATPVAGSAMGKAPDDTVPPLLNRLDVSLALSGYLHAEITLMERTVGVLAPDIVNSGSGSKTDATLPMSMSDYAGMIEQNLGVLLQRLQAVNARISGVAPSCGPQGSQS